MMKITYPIDGDLLERVSDGLVIQVVDVLAIVKKGVYVGCLTTGGHGGGVFLFKKEEWRKIGDKGREDVVPSSNE